MKELAPFLLAALLQVTLDVFDKRVDGILAVNIKLGFYSTVCFNYSVNYPTAQNPSKSSISIIQIRTLP